MRNSEVQDNDAAPVGPWTIQYGVSAATGRPGWFVKGPEVWKPHGVEVVPLSVAENLAKALEGLADHHHHERRGIGCACIYCKALTGYRAAHPREETTG